VDVALINPPETDKKGNKRDFSLCSAPYEENLEITTCLRDSAFKRVFQKAPIGTELDMEGPFGSFTLHNAFIGVCPPPEPWGRNATEKTVGFWSNNALVWGTEGVIPGTQTSVCPWR